MKIPANPLHPEPLSNAMGSEKGSKIPDKAQLVFNRMSLEQLKSSGLQAKGGSFLTNQLYKLTGHYTPIQLVKDQKVVTQMVKIKQVAQLLNTSTKSIHDLQQKGQLSSQLPSLIAEAKTLEIENAYHALQKTSSKDDSVKDAEKARGAATQATKLNPLLIKKVISEALKSLPEDTGRLMAIHPEEAAGVYLSAAKNSQGKVHFYLLLDESPLGTGAQGTIRRIFDIEKKEIAVLKEGHSSNQNSRGQEDLESIEKEYRILNRLYSQEKAPEGLIEKPRAFLYFNDPLQKSKKTGQQSFGFMTKRYSGDLSLKADSPISSLSPAAKIKGAEQLLKGLQFMHAHHMVHQDIKPGNVLYAQKEGNQKGNQKESYDFRLADFDNALNLKEKIELNEILGTLAYIPLGFEQETRKIHRQPPSLQRTEQLEQILKARDIFAMGCVIYQLLADAPAFGPENLNQSAVKVDQGFIRMDSQVDFSLLEKKGHSKETIQLLQRMLNLQGEASHRQIPSAAEVLQLWQKINR